MNNAERTLIHGDKFPYDAPDAFWNDEIDTPPAPKHWSQRAARGVLADLQDRRTIKRGFEEIDEDVRVEIISTLAAIIHQAWLE